MLDIARLKAARPGAPIYYFASIGSTMTEAARLAGEDPQHGASQHGTMVIADEQTAGIGRLGRNWISAPGEGVYCSILLHLNLPPAELPVASLLLGLAVAETIQKVTNLSCDLRWPNDILVNDKKVCGILTQLVDSWVVAGIGINVNQTHFEAGLRTPASSLLIESGAEQSRELIVITLLDSINSFCQLLETQGSGAILIAFSALSSYVSGRSVTVEDSGLQGITAGLDECGFLLLRDSGGRIHRLSAGGVRATVSS